MQPDEFFADVAVAYQQEIKELYAAGCRDIQFDDPLLAYFCAESMIKGMESLGIDHEALLDTYIRAYNACLKDRPTDMVVGLHLCRGNFKDGMHFSEGGYDRIAIKLFQQINVDTYYLEYDTPRAGTFEPLKFLPKNKSVVLGLVSSKIPQVSTMAALDYVDGLTLSSRWKTRRSLKRRFTMRPTSLQADQRREASRKH
jgi:methionine synthase II (cobalamin-independent)